MSEATRGVSTPDEYVPPPRYARPTKYVGAKARRDEMRRLGICINGWHTLPTKTGEPHLPNPRRSVEHGPVIAGGKCQRCLDVHKKSRGSGEYIAK